MKFRKGQTGYWKGKKRSPFSEEWKKKMSEAHKGNKNALGKKHTDEQKLAKSLKQKGHVVTIETRRKISIKQIGEKNHNWKGGVTSKEKIIRMSLEYRLWRESVFKRDNWTCQECRIASKKGNKVILHPHHKKYFSLFPKLRFDIDNGITLCSKCHQNKHKNIKLTNV